MELRDKNGLTEKEFLENYREKAYPKPSVTADICVFAERDGKYSLLLIRRGVHPFLGCYALPGGFANQNEPLDATAARELQEETNLQDLALSPIGLFSTPGRDPRGWVISEAFYTIAVGYKPEPRAADDAKDAEWFDLSINENTVRLTNGKDCISIVYTKRTQLLPGGKHRAICQAENSPLAFDHAQIIISAMTAAGLCG